MNVPTSQHDSNFCLRNHFLIAMPNTDMNVGDSDDYFTQSVVYMCDHTPKGSSGIVINKPANLTFEQLFNKIHLPLERTDLYEQAIFDGGPVDTNKGFILHETIGDTTGLDGYESSITIPEMGVQLTSSKDIIDAISQGAGPENVLMVLGYAAWHGGQLEDELAANMWLTVEADWGIIFDTPTAQRYTKALALLGLHEQWAVVPQAGRA